jgi:hypothetical protein
MFFTNGITALIQVQHSNLHCPRRRFQPGDVILLMGFGALRTKIKAEGGATPVENSWR